MKSCPRIVDPPGDHAHALALYNDSKTLYNDSKTLYNDSKTLYNDSKTLYNDSKTQRTKQDDNPCRRKRLLGSFMSLKVVTLATGRKTTHDVYPLLYLHYFMTYTRTRRVENRSG